MLRQHLHTRLLAASTVLCVCLGLLTQAQAVEFPPDDSGKVIFGQTGPVGDWEVRLYSQPNFDGMSASYYLEPGTRQRLVKRLPQGVDCRSIKVGAQVDAALFVGSLWRTHQLISTRDRYGGWMVVRTIARETSNLELLPPGFSAKVCGSLIVSPASQGELGVMLHGRDTFYFVPLPESESDVEVWYNSISTHPANAEGPQFVEEPEVVSLHLTDARLAVELASGTYMTGERIRFPDGEPVTLNYHLPDYGWGSKPRSLILKWTAPTETAKLAPGAAATIQAAAVKTSQAAPANLSGTWSSAQGLVYELTQRQELLVWRAPALGEIAIGTVSGLDVSATWAGKAGSGEGKGRIVNDSTGRAVRIEWENGVVFTRK